MNQSSFESIPRHVGIIMDGNGRWANQQDKPRVYGHQNATQAVHCAVEAASRMGVEVLTLYAFSTENWKRPQAEIDVLMHLFAAFLKAEMPNLMKNKIRLITIGSTEKLPASVRTPLTEVITQTKKNTRLTLCLAVNYGAKDEITRTARKLAAQVATGQLKPEDISEELFNQNLDTANLPPLDLVIRTSGEQRLSNFLLWQAAYAEFYFTNVLWPDFDEAQFEKAVKAYARRNRRVGAIHG